MILRQPGPFHRDREGYEGNNSNIFCSVGQSIYYKKNPYSNTIINQIDKVDKIFIIVLSVAHISFTLKDTQ